MPEVVDSIIAELIARDNGYIATFDKATAAHGRFKASIDKLKVGTFDLAAEGQKYKAGSNAIGQAEEQTTARITRSRKTRVDVAVASDKAIAASAKVTADKQIAEAERAARLSAVAQRAVDRKQAGLQRGTGAMFGSSVPAGGSFVPPSVVPVAAEEVAAEKEINHLLADQATLQASLTVARGRDRDIIRDQITEMRLFNSLVRAGYTDEEATLQVEKRMLAIEAERVRIAKQQTGKSVGQFAAGAGLGRFGGLNAATGGIAAAAALAVGVGAVSSAIDFAKEIKNTADAVGLTTRQVQIYEAAARQAGVSTDQFRSGIGQLSTFLGRAKDGDEAAAKTFEALGINIKKAGSAGDILPTLIDRISSIADPAQRAAVETRLFGEEGRKLDAMLSGGNERVNELAAALEKTGAVLSGSDIQRLTDAEAKLAGVKAQLQVDLAQVVAKNADAITGLAQSFAELADSIATALGKVDQFAKATAVGRFVSNPYDAGAQVRSTIVNGVKSFFGYSTAPSSAEAAIPARPTPLGNVQPGKAGDLSGLFAPKLPKGKSAETLAHEAAARERRFNDQMARLSDEQLRARADTTSDEQERSAIAVEQINRERAASIADIKGNVDFSAAQKKRLIAAQNAASDDQIGVVENRDRLSNIQRQAAAETLLLDQKDAELHSQEDLATTVAERRRIELQLLANDQERQRIAGQTVLDRAKTGDSSLNAQDIATARANLNNLPAQGARDAASVKARNLGPGASFLRDLPNTADQLNEALEGVQVDGLQHLTDGITDAITGVHSLGDAFKEVSKQIIADLVRIAIQKAIVAPLAGALFGGSGTSGILSGLFGARASGGNVVAGSPYIVGEHGPELFCSAHLWQH
jgi:hypothetical protein